ncbi:MAG: OB-fold nucleic acid binding domain-containing protein, partial [Treponema sp.]|nr:OB-fold nucleic acid binding domain-containing protein [Treponema sp.]
MVKRIKFNPVLYAAVGAVLGFYVLGTLSGIKGILVILLVPVAALCIFRVLASLYSQSRTLRLTAVYSAAFAAGLCLGIGAAGASDKALGFGIPGKSVKAINGALLEDPRIIQGGRAMAALSLRECAGNAGLRVSAHGELTVFFPEDSAQRLKEFGRGTVVFAEGNVRESSGGGWIFSAESMHIAKPAPALERFRTRIRMSLISRFDAASAGASWGGLALALWLGIRDSLDSGLTTLYRNAGCS